jgi:hypothetical protein
LRRRKVKKKKPKHSKDFISACALIMRNFLH